MKKKVFTLEEVKTIIKAFHLDSVNGKYNKKLLNWCNKWIKNNII